MGDDTKQNQFGPLRAPAAGASLLATLTPELRYEVLSTLGRGGMGVVYQVRDRELDEVIAIKVLDPLAGPLDEAIGRFKREIKVARRINHPNVAQLYDLFVWNGRMAISQQFIDGRNLGDILAGGRLGMQTVRRYLRYLCSALHAAHKLGVVHRDLKPANILIDRADRPHVLDFGIAFLSGQPRGDTPGTVFGTPYYMSPEQAFYPEEVDHRSDIYSLGVLLFRMLTGEVPFQRDDAQEVFHAHLKDPPPRPSSVCHDLPRAVDAVVLRCLAKRSIDRFGSAREVYESFEAALGADAGPVGVPAATVAASVPHAEPAGLVPADDDGGGGGGLRVLVVDDDRLLRLVVGDALRELGASVTEAADGYIAVEAAMASRPSLILLDIEMPVLDGREALRILKSNPATASIPVVMMTSLDDPAEGMLAREVGAAMFLNKPVPLDVLEMVLEKFAGRSVAPA